MKVSFTTKAGKRVSFFAHRKKQHGSGCNRPRRGGCPKGFIMGQNRTTCYPCDDRAIKREFPYQYKKRKHSFISSGKSRIPKIESRVRYHPIHEKFIYSSTGNSKIPKLARNKRTQKKKKRRRRTAIELLNDQNDRWSKWN